ncbi:hypothetical protein BJ978_003217 [Agromyces terreus]|uniref:DUF664 domain-containing protein n=1 Tax=Agromyces terreus TaxID=424795 RepID=A0A9X2H3F5_9MICO|nr:hypothetical protein [Agromyces terreus]MCP2372541.1 hypothetical protein [Agromyces terreus]
MQTILTFADHLRLIDERSAAFRAAIEAAPSLDLPVLTSDPNAAPGRTLFDLVRHVGVGRRKTAAIVAAGPADAPPAKSAWESAAGAPPGARRSTDLVERVGRATDEHAA